MLRNELLHVMVEAEVDHVEQAITSHCCCYTFVQSTQTVAIFANNLPSLGYSRRLLTRNTSLNTMTFTSDSNLSLASQI